MTEEASKTRRLERTCAVVAVAIAALLVMPGVLLAEALNATAWDSAAQALCAQRVATLPGGIYTAGTDHKGPLWTSLYVLAWVLAPSSTTVWYMIGAFAVLVAGLTAEVVRRLVLALGGASEVALGVALALFAHLLFGDTEYAGVLYSRNLTALLTALAFLLALHAGRAAGAREVLLAAASGTALGWAVQTMPTSALAAVVVAAALAFALGGGQPTRAALRARWRSLASFGASALAPLLLVPAYYALRGELADFWQLWWTYNQIYRAAIPADVAQRWPLEIAEGLGWNLAQVQFLVPLLTFGLGAALEARHRRRFGPLVLLVLAWFVAECVGLSLSLRFFGHYFVVSLLPAVVLGGVAASRLPLPAVVRAAAPLVLLVASLVFCPRLERALGRVRLGGFEGGYEDRLRRAGPGVVMACGVVDLVSELDEDVYVWARRCSLAPLLRRRSPTRYVENRWLTGEIYGWNEPPDPRQILPGTEERWTRDVTATPPAAVVEWGATTIPPGSAVARWREAGFELVLNTEAARVDVDRGRWAWIESARARALAGAGVAQVGSTWRLADGVGGADLVCASLPEVSLPAGGALVVRVEREDGAAAETKLAADEAPLRCDVDVLVRHGALVVLRDGAVVDAKRLPRGASRLVLVTSGGARVPRVGLVQGLRPPWTAPPDGPR